MNKLFSFRDVRVWLHGPLPRGRCSHMVPYRIQTGTGVKRKYTCITNLELSGNHLVLCVLCNWLCPHLRADPSFPTVAFLSSACIPKAQCFHMICIIQNIRYVRNLIESLEPGRSLCKNQGGFIECYSMLLLMLRVFQRMEREGGGRLMPVLPQGDWRY